MSALPLLGCRRRRLHGVFIFWDRNMKDSSTLPRTARGLATREALLGALEEQIAAAGFDGLTSTSVAAAAGVSTGTFYGYFDDKHDALAGLFALRLDGLLA